MEIDALIDTSLFIAYVRQQTGESRLEKTIEEYELQLPAVSVVTKFEYERGELFAGRKPRFEPSFSGYIVIELNEKIWWRAAHIDAFSRRAVGKMDLADLLIASTAIQKSVPLFTLNVQHFAHLRMKPYQLRLPKIP